MGDLLRILFSGWHAEPVPLAAAAAAAVLYGRGARARRAEGLTPSRAQVACLALGVASILVALLSPIDTLALRLQWVHMVQHLILLVVAPPLVMMARPLGTARAALAPSLESALRAALPRRAGGQGAGAYAATAVAILFVGVLWLWHVPALYNATLANDAVHDLEHTTFLLAGLVYWATIVGRPSWAPDLGAMGRGVLAISGMVGSWMLAIYLGYAPAPLYEYTGNAGLSALADQQLAAGTMWVPGSIPFVIALTFLFARWFDEDAGATATEMRAGA